MIEVSSVAFVVGLVVCLAVLLWLAVIFAIKYGTKLLFMWAVRRITALKGESGGV